ncbi:MAG: hypothetical protein H7A52_03540 [Akkermansiaceae bacterium]|nr:hypothetical protein [Akkermansiaceae bacterium]
MTKSRIAGELLVGVRYVDGFYVLAISQDAVQLSLKAGGFIRVEREWGEIGDSTLFGLRLCGMFTLAGPEIGTR